jgi:ABC-type transport system substrate-binding protein/class 3 adenylate cyclase
VANDDAPPADGPTSAGARDLTPSGGDDGRSAEIRTFLIADVRGYTKYTQEHGDQAAAELAATFARLVGEIVPARQGTLLELRGDEALVVFASARQALRAAVELQARFADAALPRGVGIGLDAGEAVPVGEGYRGGALNLAARLCSQAAPGEILASEGMIHLAAKVDGVAYVDPRTLKLKGYAEPIRAFTVVSEDRARTFTLRRRLSLRTRRSIAHRWARVALAVVVLAAIAAALLPRILVTKASPLLRIGSGLAVLDAKTEKEIGSIPSSVVKGTAGDIYADGHYWVLDTEPTSFVEVDARTGREVAAIPSPVENVAGFDVSGNDLWVTALDKPELAETDIRLRRTIQTFTLSTDPNWQCCQGGVLFAAGSVWVSHFDFPHGELLRIDPATGKIQHTFPDLLNLGYPVYGDGSIWVSGGPQSQGGMLRVDPRTNTIAAQASIQNNTILVAAGGGFGWTTDSSRGLVYKLDRNGNVVGTYSIGDSALGLSYSDGVVWACNQDGGSVTGIDVATGARRNLQFTHPLHGVAAGDGTLLVDVAPGELTDTLIRSLPGKVALLLTSGGPMPEADPALAAGPFPAQVEFATCARLLNYPERAGPDGWTLQPEVAATMPTVSPDGLTYTYTVRPGYRFSPPSNQPLTAETFRYSIERALSPKLQGPASENLGDIEGEQEFLDGKADHITGLQAEGNTLTIRLRQPTPDLPQRLAVPYFCPVPTDTPIVPDGDVLPSGLTPSAGPYYLAHNDNEELAVLKRNPNYHGPRAHPFDAIVIREGIDPVKEVQRVDSGGWDGIIDEGEPLQGGGPIDQRWGPHGTSAARSGQRFYLSPSFGTLVLLLNAGRPLFSDQRVRLAVAYAVDRPELAAIADGVPTDSALPSFEPDSDHGRFPVNGPDLTMARELMHGVHGTAVLVVSQYSQGQIQQGEALKAELAPIGIDVRIKTVPSSVEAISQPNAPYDLKIGGVNNEPLLSAAAYLGLFQGFPSDWFPPGVVDAFVQMLNLPTEQAAQAFIRGPLQSQAALIGLADQVDGSYFGPKVGCRIFPPASFGVDLAALCPQP